MDWTKTGWTKNGSTAKMTASTRTAVREKGVYRYHGGPIHAPPETPWTSEYYRIE